MSETVYRAYLFDNSAPLPAQTYRAELHIFEGEPTKPERMGDGIWHAHAGSENQARLLAWGWADSFTNGHAEFRAVCRHCRACILIDQPTITIDGRMMHADCVTVEEYEDIATDLELAAILDEQATEQDACPHCNGTGLVPAEDASHDPDDCIHCAPIDWDIQLALVEHQEIQQATDCTGDPLDDDEPDDARDVTDWEGGKASYR